MSDTATASRSCYRLVALLRAGGSAEQLQTVELLALADWLAQPPDDAGAWKWAEEVCLPIVAELGRRLGRARDSQSIDVPRLLAQVHAMRNAQRAEVSARNKTRAEKLALAHARAVAEKSIDDLIDRHLQPSLF